MGRRYAWTDNDEFWCGIESSRERCLKAAKKQGWKTISLCKISGDYRPKFKSAKSILSYLLQKDDVYPIYDRLDTITEKQYNELKDDLNKTISRWMFRNDIHFSFDVHTDTLQTYDVGTKKKIKFDGYTLP